MYQVLARKWRPQSFDDLVGQPQVTRTLRNAIESGRLAHAYLFAGVRGTGKTTAARLLAKCLNCESGPTPDPCNRCTPCREIAQGRSLDVIELDAATHTGIDNIRELQEMISHGPVRDRSKMLILDEAHMLSRHSANALLKVVEEPPAGVVFVLATTELQKIPSTIVSRCQLFEFRRVTVREVSARLRKVCEAEGVTITDATLERVARTGEGSVRDSLSVLERLIACCGDDVQDEEALRALGAVRTEVLADMVDALARREPAAMLRTLDGLVEEGHDLVHFWGEWIAVLRDLLLLRTVGRGAGFARSLEEMEALERAAAPLSRQDLTRVFQILADLEPGLKSSGQPRFLFEATLIRLADLGAVRPIEALLAEMNEARSGGSPRPATTLEPQKKKAAEPPGAQLDTFRGELHRVRPMLDAMLDQASELGFERDRLVVRFAASAESLRRQMERHDYQDLLRACAGKAAGRTIDVAVLFDPVEGSVLPSEPRDPPLASVSPADARPEPVVAEPEAAVARPAAAPGDLKALLLQACAEPGIKKLLDEFGAQVIDIRPLADTGPLTEPPADAKLEEYA